LYSDELTWVDTHIEAIKPARSGLSNSKISSLRDPIIFLYKKKLEIKSEVAPKVVKNMVSSSNSMIILPKTIIKKRKLGRGLILEAIMNTSALISGRWYKLNDSVGSYKLSKVNRNSVVISKNGRNKTLSTNSKKTTLKFKK
jgi:hypothetical protein